MKNEELEKNMFEFVLNDLIEGRENVRENFMNKINKMLDG